jgi:hypothetical protein
MAHWHSLYVWLVVVGALMLAYVALFLTGKDVAIRPRGIFILLLCAVAEAPVARIWPKSGVSFPSQGAFRLTACETLQFALFWAALLVYFTGCSFRLIHAAPGAVRRELDEVCRRLSLRKEDEPSALLLTSKGVTLTVAVIPVGSRFVLLIFRRDYLPGKLHPFVAWLSERYPGPVARLFVRRGRAEAPPSFFGDTEAGRRSDER